MSAETTDAIMRSDPLVADDAASQSQCDGCRQLAQRVERLEKQIREIQDRGVISANLGTTSCYWICMGVHVFGTFCLFSNMFLIQLGIVSLVGACGTAAVCHVFSTRSIPEKTLRTLLSCGIVASAAVLALAMQDSLDIAEFFPALLLYLLPMLVSGWFVAKVFVWTRSWRLVPPGYPDDYPKLQIRHLMACTLFVAIYLGVARWAIDDVSELLGDDVVLVFAYIAVPMVLATLFSSILARILLSRKSTKIVRNLCLFSAAMVLLVVVGYCAVYVWFGGESVDMDELVLIVVYMFIGLLGLFASPVFTFAMLRAAGYRWLHP